MERLIQIEAARIPDRDRMLAILANNGTDARAVDEVGIRVHCDDGGCGPAVYSHVEDTVLDLGSAFVPIKHDGVIYLRPPVG
jgi:hypothetical protein